VLLTLAEGGSLPEGVIAGWRDRLVVASGALAVPRAELEGVATLLVRPDGHVGWAGMRGHSAAQLEAALTVLCGAPTR
jgi:hypothetical protein